MPIQLKNATPPASNQDAFDRVWQHFIVEGNPRCVDLGGGSFVCVYRNPSGNGCAVGCMLPDSMAAKADGFKATVYHAPLWDLCKDWFANVNIDLLRAMQSWHDSGGLYPDAGKLRHIATAYNITIPTCTSSQSES